MGAEGQCHLQKRRVLRCAVGTQQYDGGGQIGDHPDDPAGEGVFQGGVRRTDRRRPDADPADVPGKRLAAAQGQIPGREVHEGVVRLCVGEVLTAGDPGGSLSPGTGKERLQRTGGLGASALQNADPAAVSEYFAPGT